MKVKYTITMNSGETVELTRGRCLHKDDYDDMANGAIVANAAGVTLDHAKSVEAIVTRREAGDDYDMLEVIWLSNEEITVRKAIAELQMAESSCRRETGYTLRFLREAEDQIRSAADEVAKLRASINEQSLPADEDAPDWASRRSPAIKVEFPLVGFVGDIIGRVARRNSMVELAKALAAAAKAEEAARLWEDLKTK